MRRGFRVWDKENEEYMNGYDVLLRYDGSVISRYALATFDTDMPVNVIIEWDTGLKDKNGEKIYDGDIVDYTGECTCVVQYEDEGARFIHRDISDDFPFGFNGLEGYNGKLFEVIGNIHENPELIGDKE